MEKNMFSLGMAIIFGAALATDVAANGPDSLEATKAATPKEIVATSGAAAGALAPAATAGLIGLGAIAVISSAGSSSNSTR